MVWKPQPHGPIDDWLGLENKDSATRGRHDPITGSEIPPYIYNSDNLGTKTVIPPGRNLPARCGNPNPTDRSLIGWGSHLQPTHPGDDRFPSPYHKYFHTFTTPKIWGTWGRNRPTRCGNSSPTGRSLIDWGSYIEPAHPGEGRFPSPH